MLSGRRERWEVAHAEDAHFPLESSTRAPRVVRLVRVAPPDDVQHDGVRESLAGDGAVERVGGAVRNTSGPRARHRQRERIVVERTVKGLVWRADCRVVQPINEGPGE